MKKLLLILALLLLASPVWAADLYVATTGNDTTGDGSIGNPWKTVQKAANEVNAGDTVHIRAGTYNGRVALARSGSPDNYITFQPYTGETVYITGSGLGNGIMFSAMNVSYIKIIGLKIHTYTGAGITIETTGTYDASHIEIRNNEIYNNTYTSVYGHGIKINTSWPAYGCSGCSISDVIVDRNNLHDLDTSLPAPGGNETVTFAGNIDKFQITNNTLTNVSFIGIDMIGKGTEYPRNGIVAGNTVDTCGWEAPAWASTGIYIDGAKNITIENNTIKNCYVNGIYTGNENQINEYETGPAMTTENIIIRRNKAINSLRNISIGGGYFGSSQNGRVVHNTAVTTTTGRTSNYYLSKGTGHIGKNNIGYFSSTGTFYMLESHYQIADNVSLDYNNYYTTGTAVWYWHGGDYDAYSTFSAYKTAKSPNDAHSITTDPLFTNVGTFDLTLQSDSPAINTGTYLTTVSSGCGAGVTTATLADARYFHDGYGISGVSGDSIMIGTDTVTVTDVNYTTGVIEWTPAITCVDGEGVSYPYFGSAPDMGYQEYASITGTGGFIIGGTSAVKAGMNITPSGGAVMGGTSPYFTSFVPGVISVPLGGSFGGLINIGVQ